MPSGSYIRTEYHREITRQSVKDFYTRNPEVKIKQSEWRKKMGIVPPSNKGLKMSDEQKEKISIARKNHFNLIGRKERRPSFHQMDSKYYKWRTHVSQEMRSRKPR